jgi:hypothetical protein
VSRHGRASAVVARVLEGEKMVALCGEFGISRKTGDFPGYCSIKGLTIDSIDIVPDEDAGLSITRQPGARDSRYPNPQ